MSVEEVIIDGTVCAVIISSDYDKQGIQFFTGPAASMQIGSMSYNTGKTILSHSHNRISREIAETQEALFLRKGRLRVDFYRATEEYATSRILSAGDVILLTSGGHGFEVLEPVNIIEVKQGPYAGENEKTWLRTGMPTEPNFG